MLMSNTMKRISGMSVEAASGRFGESAWMRHPLPARPVDRAAALVQGGQARGEPARLRPLHLNESPYPPSPKAVAAMAASAAGVNRYPDPNARLLCAELSARSGIPASRIACANGSEELIQVLCTLGAGPGDEVVVPAPAFPGIAISATLRNAVVARVPLDARGANDAQALLAAITARTRVVFSCSPHPPSGGMMEAAALQQLIQGVPDNVLLVMDEAYHEFGRHAGGPDILAALAGRRGPWVNLRTFSKAYGLAGARVGYAFCSSDEIADAVRRVKTTYGPSAMSLAGALAALQDDAYLATVLDAVARERDRMTAGLRALGLQPFASLANFVSVALPMPGAQAMQGLHARGILVRDWRDPDYQKEIRITVGLAEDTDAVLQAIKEILAEAPAAGTGI